MSILDAYGDFDLPEEKSVIEVVEDPAKVILSTYEVYNKICSKLNGLELHLNAYDRAKKLFEGKEKLKPDEKSVKKILEEITKHSSENRHFFETGAFLSAMQNMIDLEVLTINEKLKVFHIGTNLKDGKTLVLGPKFYANYIGAGCKGNILNYGTGGSFSPFLKGTHINNGNITFSNSFGDRFKNAMIIYNTFGQTQDWLVKIKNTAFLPWKKGTLEIREYEKNGMPEKKYELHELIQPHNHKSHLLYPENLTIMNSPTSQKLLNILAKLEQFLVEDSALAKLRTKTTFEQADEIVKQMKKYDVKSLEHEIDKFAEEIMEASKNENN